MQLTRVWLDLSTIRPPVLTNLTDSAIERRHWFTGVTITPVGLLSSTDALGWQIAFALLAAGPLVGIVAMGRLHDRPDAARMANGNR